MEKELPSRGFTKLDSGIIYSTLWTQSHDTLRVWIALLALCDAHGMVRSSVTALAHICYMGVERMEEILNEFQSPDKYSRIKDHEGRKIKAVEGGWIILNYLRYRNLMQRKALSHAERQKRYREKSKRKQGHAKVTTTRHGKVTQMKKHVTPVLGKVTRNVTRDTEAEAEAEAESRSNALRVSSTSGTRVSAKASTRTKSLSSSENNTCGNSLAEERKIPDHYNSKAQEVIKIWHSVAVASRLRFLPVDLWTQATQNAIEKYEDDLPAVRSLFEHAVQRERNKPTRWSKNLCRVLNDALTGQHWFEDYDYSVNGTIASERP